MFGAEETATEEERATMREVLLQMREDGDEYAILTAVNSEGVAFSYTLDDNDELRLLATSEDKDPLYG